MGSSTPKGPQLIINPLKTVKYIHLFTVKFGCLSTHPNKKLLTCPPPGPPAFPRVLGRRRGGNRGAAFLSYFPACPAASSALARFFPALEAAGSVMKPCAPSG